MKRILLLAALALSLAPLGAEARSAKPEITWIEASPGYHRHDPVPTPQLVICPTGQCLLNAVSFTVEDPDSGSGRFKFDVFDESGRRVGGEPYETTGEVPFDGSVVNGLWRHDTNLPTGYYRFKVTVRDDDGRKDSAWSEYVLYI